MFWFTSTKAYWMGAIVLLLQALACAGDVSEVWTVDLKKQDFRKFQTQINLTWSKQQNVIFLPSGRLLIYQVNQLAQPGQLVARDHSGGAGNFFLEIRVIGARDGKLLQSLRLPTNAGLSGILPLKNGKLLVRTGEILRLCTEDFHTLAVRTLPLKREDPIELWQMDVSPSGGQIVLVHEQAMPAPSSIADEEAVSEVEILDPDTLKTVRYFSVPQRISPWSAGDGFLVAAVQEHGIGELRFGKLDFQGKWSPLAVKGEHCHYHLAALAETTIAAHGCGKLILVNAAGERLFRHKIGLHGLLVGSAIRSGRYLAVQLNDQMLINIPGANYPLRVPKPARLELYDLAASKRLLAIGAEGENLYYAISAGGILAVIKGSTLTLYQMETE